jgi:hypothetical protein
MIRLILVLALAAQIGFWYSVKDIKPNLEITPEIPTANQTEAFSLGDRQFFFRAKTLDLQMAGDTFGRTTALKDYDYPLLKKWFFYLDTLDSKSNFTPSIAAYYFSRTQNPPDVIYTLDYLEAHADKDPTAKWWWYSQAIYLANSVLGDKERALEIAVKLRNVKGDLPIWARQMEAFMREDLGDKDSAEAIMCDVFANFKDIPDFERNFMMYFFQERMNTVQDKDMNEIAKRCAIRKMMGSV